jgi:hypothetical protein
MLWALRSDQVIELGDPLQVLVAIDVLKRSRQLNKPHWRIPSQLYITHNFVFVIHDLLPVENS